MSAQAYTNRLRILAEIGVRKVQYQKQTALNRNPLLAAANCNPDFTPITYIPACFCPFNNTGNATPIPPPPPPIVCIPTYDGGSSLTEAVVVYDGVDSVTVSLNAYPILSGGALNNTCTTTYLAQQIYDGGNVNTNSTDVLPGINNGGF